MTDTARLAGAAHVIAEALETLTPEQRKKAIECALMLCPPEAIEPPKKKRSDAGTMRKKSSVVDVTDEKSREASGLFK